ncbi:hypothetical protein H2136_06865 [Aeromonas hydrophila]|uniref:Uncharacterized protein n=1 Tax=Aeromonas hydrophila TaxID=644 RepID=A0A926FHF4_AERHY|nr:hypothetical protein [Aeromonas hydrophila]
MDQAVELIQQESEACQTMLHDLLRAIEDKPVAGLILGKFSRARELGVELVLIPIRRWASTRRRCRRISSPSSATCWTTASAPPGPGASSARHGC